MSESSKDKNDDVKNEPSNPVEDLKPTLIHEIGTPADDSIANATSSKYSSRGEPRQGGMAIVWKAYDSQLQREVAYKELRPETAGDTRYQSMFVNEAKLTGQLEHPNIVPVYELGQADSKERPFYTMKYLRGVTLTEAIREKRSQSNGHPDPRVRFAPMLKILLRVCDAMRYAHSRGIIHRDLKPDNVMVGDYGEVVVLDWGLAKPIAANESELPPIRLGVKSRNETEIGVRKGTPAYWAPEQAEGRNDLVDQRTDVFGIGAILYEMLSGNAPHARRNGASGNSAIRSRRRARPNRKSGRTSINLFHNRSFRFVPKRWRRSERIATRPSQS